jgi:hypothetical protein
MFVFIFRCLITCRWEAYDRLRTEYTVRTEKNSTGDFFIRAKELKKRDEKHGFNERYMFSRL